MSSSPAVAAAPCGATEDQRSAGWLQEPKYRFIADAVLNRASGELIPHDEPVFVFRARDKHAASTLRFYMDTVDDATHAYAIRKRVDDFERFAREHPERMKEPDTAPSSEDQGLQSEPQASASCQTRDDLKTALEASQARQRELEEALRPFAKTADWEEKCIDPDYGIPRVRPLKDSRRVAVTLGECRAARSALLNSPAREQPEGWVLVPREPTEAMETAGAEMHGETEGFGLTQQVELVYRAMIFAAPSPTGGER